MVKSDLLEVTPYGNRLKEMYSTSKIGGVEIPLSGFVPSRVCRDLLVTYLDEDIMVGIASLLLQ